LNNWILLKDSVTFKLTNVRCDSYNKSWVQFNECRLKAINRHRVVFNFNATFVHPTRNIFVLYQMFKRESGYKPWLFKYSIDCCRFLKAPFNPFAIMVYDLYKDFSNVNHTCPLFVSFFKRNRKISDMYLSTDVMRLPLPTGDYLLSIDWIFYGISQFATNVSFQFV
ncbi:hypothetical protein KR074_004606, partial [Drosophila pseudoananassae]